MLDAVETHLTQPITRSVVMPGNTIVEDTPCGQLHVRLISIVGSSGLSKPSMQPCLPLYQVRIGVGVARCAHVVDDGGNPPTPGEMAYDAFQTFQDRADIVEALVCTISQFEEVNTLRIEDWLPSGPQGGVVSGEQTFTFNHVLCTPCPEEDDLP